MVAEGHGDAGHARATGAADAVNVGLGLVGEFVVDDVGDIIDIDAACGDIGGDEDGRAPGLEVGESALAHVLPLIAVDGLGGDSIAEESLDDLVGPVLGAGEDEGAAHGGGLEDGGEEGGLVGAMDVEDRVGDEGGEGRGRGDIDSDGVGEEGVGKAADLFGHGGGEEKGLALLGHGGGDSADRLDEAHVEHAVGLIKDEDLDVAKIDVALLHEVFETAGGCDDDIDTIAEGADLRALADTAEDHDVAEVGVFGVDAEVFGDLEGEFARGAEDEGADVAARAVVATGGSAVRRACAVAGVSLIIVAWAARFTGLVKGVIDRRIGRWGRGGRHKTLGHGEAEGGGFAGAGLRTAEHIFARENVGNGFELDGCGNVVARAGDGAQDGLAEPEVGKLHMIKCLETPAKVCMWADRQSSPNGCGWFPHGKQHPHSHRSKGVSADGSVETVQREPCGFQLRSSCWQESNGHSSMG